MAKLLEPFNWYICIQRQQQKTIKRDLASDKRTFPEWRITSSVQCYFSFYGLKNWPFRFQLSGTGSRSLASPCAASDANQLKRLVADNERISDHVQPVQTETYTNSGILNNAIAPYALSPLYIQPYLLQCRISECMYKYMVEKNIHHPGMDLILTQRAIGSFYVLFCFFRCIAFQFLCGASR